MSSLTDQERELLKQLKKKSASGGKKASAGKDTSSPITGQISGSSRSVRFSPVHSLRAGFMKKRKELQEVRK